MSTTKKIAHNTGIQIIGKAISTLLGLFAIGMLMRYLGTEKFGWYTTALSFLQFGAILIDFGMIPVGAQMLSSDKYEEKTIFQNLLGFRFSSALLFFCILPLFSLFLSYPYEAKISIFILSFSFFFTTMNQIFVAFYQKKLLMYIQVIGEIINRIILVLGIILFTQQSDMFFYIMSIIVFSSLAYTIFLWFMTKQRIQVKLSYDAKIWKTIIQNIWPVAIAIIFNVMYLKGDILILAQFSSQTEVGLYGGAYRVLDIVTQTAMMLMGVILPLLSYNWAQNLKKEFKKRLQQSFDGMMLFAIPMSVGMILLSKKIMVLIGGEKFLPSSQFLSILALAVLGVYLGAVFGHAAVAIQKQKKVLWVYISGAVLTVIGYFYFIPNYGGLGAAWMTVFSELYVGILLGIVVLYYTKVRLSLITIIKILFSAALMGYSLILFPNIHIILSVLLGIVVYSSTILITKTIPIKTIKEIIRL